mmetsp:Transcript_32869/g.29169  ORF Transcript_32869/g.29169 Transcript_32869/m.29169 type:complete len:139 (-) Transcript_32869:24-440(-)
MPIFKSEYTHTKEQQTNVEEEGLHKPANFGNKEIIKLLSKKKSPKIRKNLSTKNIRKYKKIFQNELEMNKEKDMLMVTSKSILPLSPNLLQKKAQKESYSIKSFKKKRKSVVIHSRINNKPSTKNILNRDFEEIRFMK